MNRSDNFNRTGSVALGGATPSDGGGTWTDQTSDFATGTDGVSGQLVAFVSSAFNVANQWNAWLDCAVTDHESTGEIIALSTTHSKQAGITARLFDNSNYYYYFSSDLGATSLYKNVAGTFTLMGTGTHTFSPGVGNTISLKAQGSTITAYVGATPDITHGSDATLDAKGGTKAGIRADTSDSHPYFNSFTITDLSGGGGGGILYTQLERGTRGLVRGVYGGSVG